MRGAPLRAEALDKMSSPLPTDVQFLMLANIRDGIIDANLPYLTGIENKLKKYCLKNHCIILSKNGKPFKVAIAEVKDGHSILANGNLYIIEPDEEKVDPYYLAAFFESEEGIAALESITVGATIPNIGVEQLKKLVIPVPPLEEQARVAKEYKNLKDELMLLNLRIEKVRNRKLLLFEKGEETDA